MQIKQFKVLLNEESKYPPPEKYNVKTIGEYENSVKQNEVSYFVKDSKQLDLNQPNAREKFIAGKQHRERETTLPIPYEAYPFYTQVMGYFTSSYGRGKEPMRQFDLFVNALRNTNLNIYNISEKDAKAFDDTYKKLIEVFEKKNITDPEESAYKYMQRYYDQYKMNIVDHAQKSVREGENNPKVKDPEGAATYFSDKDRLSNEKFDSYMNKFFESKNLWEVTLDDFEDDKGPTKEFKRSFERWFKKEVIEKNTREKVERALNSPEGIRKIKSAFIDHAEQNNIGTEEERDSFLKREKQKKETPIDKETSKDSDEKQSPEDNVDIGNKMKEVEVSLQNIGTKRVRDVDLLKNLVKKYPNESADSLSVAYSLMDPEAPDSMPIDVGGESFTKKELISILKGLSESFIQSLKEEVLLEFSVMKRLQKLKSLIKSGKSKEELIRSKESDSEDVKGYAAQVDRIKQRVNRSPQKQINIGKKMRDMLTKMDVPTAKIRSRDDLKSLGTGVFDTIIKGLSKDNESE